MNRLMSIARIVPIILLVMLLAGCASQPVDPETTSGQEVLARNLKNPGENTLQQEQDVQTILNDNLGVGQQADGIVVGITDEHGSHVISAGTLGDGTGRSVDGDTVFEIGSITKVFTAILLQDMVDRGEMKLDDPVQKYLPDAVRMPTRGGKQITLFDLATHTSGLPRDAGTPIDTPEQLYAFLSHVQLQHDPGSNWEYSNLGVGLLGYVIAMKEGKDYESLVIERICRPLGMESTRIELSPELKTRMAGGHAFAGRAVSDTHGKWLLAGCGALCSTGNDLLRFISANLGLTPSPLTPLLKRTYSDQKLASGRTGRLVWTEDGGIIVHGGLVGGFRSNLGFDPVKRRGVVILANSSSSTIPVGLMGALLRNLSPRPPEIAPIDPACFDKLSGQYRIRAATCTVERSENRLLVQWWVGSPRFPTPFLRYEVFPQSATVFFNPMLETRITFVRDATGQATRLDITSPGFEVSIRRVSRDLPPPIEAGPPDYDAFVGRYRYALIGLIPVGPTLNLYKKHDDLGDHLFAYVQGFRTGIIGEELFPFGRSALFRPDDQDISIATTRVESGKATRILVHFEGTDIAGVRVSDQPQLPDR
jgi:serine-type D-Ala-D-Ala carboxypeptidase/endopeptidase